MKYIFTIVALCGVLLSHAQNYYVGGTGASDSNPGTAGSPFATINKAATVAVPGSTIYIRTGTYRETITPAVSGTSGNPIIFKADGGSIVTISGLNDVGTTGWSVHTGNIYKKTITLPVSGWNASSSSNTTLLANQIFRNGEMMFEARWPNISDTSDLFDRTSARPIYSGGGGGTTPTATTIVDASAPAGMVGATVWLNGWYVTMTAAVTGHSGSTLTFSPGNTDAKKRKFYYLTGLLSLLDAEKEWHYQNPGGVGVLYFRQPGGGSPSGNLEYKARNYGFDLRGKSYITIQSIKFFGCNPVEENNAINGPTASTAIIVDNIRAAFINHAVLSPWQGDAMETVYQNPEQTGIKLIGPNNIIRNSEIQWGSSQAIWIGEGGIVTNNLIHHFGYDGSFGSVMPWGPNTGSPSGSTHNQTITYNTIHTMGRSCVDFSHNLHGEHTGIELAYNNWYDYCKLNTDGGALYVGHFINTLGLETHHNWIHDTGAKIDDGVVAGLYYDQGSGPSLNHHNVLWNNFPTSGPQLGVGGAVDYFATPDYETRNAGPSRIENNVFASTNTGVGENHSYKTSTDVLDQQRNNIYRSDAICCGFSTTAPNITFSIKNDVNPQFLGTGSGGLAFRLSASSTTAIDHGATITGVTEGNVGAPDIGAYEFGGTAWTAGYVAVPFPAANTPPTVNAGPDNSISLPVTSIVFNGTASDVEGPITAYLWTKQSGPSATLTNATTQNLTASGLAAGTYVFRLTATDNNSATGYDEVTLVVNAAGTNLALNKPVTVSSLEAPQYTGNLAVDGNAGTRWSSAFSDPQWIYVDLQASYSINRVKITWDVAYAANYKIEVANSSSGPWTAISTVTGNTAQTNDLTGLSGVGSYVRMYGTVRGTGWGYSIRELEVYGTSNIAPTANAGLDKNVTGSSVVINGSGTDPDGTIFSYAWTRISGPNTPTLTGANTANLTINGLIAGTYVYRLTVTDNGGLTGTDDVSVIVTAGTNLALNKPTTVSSVESAQYPGSFAVDGNASTRWSSAFSDPQWLYVDLQANYDIQRVKITWDVAYASNFKVEVANSTSGPWTAISTITGNTSMANDLTGLSGAGRYLRVYGTARATGWGYSFFELEVYGTPAANVAPTANAGPDKAVYTSSVVINGSGTDSDGTIFSYAWARISGPNTPTLSGANTANLTISGLIAGAYVYRLTVTDNGGLTATDDVSILVNVNLALNKPAVVSSVEAAQYQGGLAVDGNASTRWSSAFSDPQWLYVDLQASYTIQRVKITWDVAYASNYKVEVANSTSGPWTAISTITGNTSMANDLTGLSGVGRYLRVYGTVRATGWGYSFFELEVYGISFGGGRLAMDVAQEPELKAETTYLFKLFPNPVNMNESVNVELSTVPGDLAVFDLIGRKQYEEHIIDHYAEIPAFKLGTGLYFFKYTADGHTDLRKIMIK